MGAWRGQPQAKPSATERVESLCQLLWNVEADWWGPGDSFRACGGSRQSRASPLDTTGNSLSFCLHIRQSHDTAARRHNLGKWKGKVFWEADVMVQNSHVPSRLSSELRLHNKKKLCFVSLSDSLKQDERSAFFSLSASVRMRIFSSAMLYKNAVTSNPLSRCVCVDGLY